MTKTAAKPSDLRPELRKTYLFVVNNFAVHASDVAEAIFEGDTKVANAALRRLGSLVNGERVNGAGPLVWQSYYDIENTDPKETLKSARADFNRAFPKPVVANVGAKPGGTGPRYTDAQIVKGLAARKAGKTNKQVAEIAGVKSPNYFSKVLKKVEAETKKAAKKPTRVVRRSTKKAGA